jgi:hypothetical protein
MTALLPKGEALRRAVRWISGEREADPERPLAALLDQANLRFDLTPTQAEALAAFYRSR